MQPATVVTRAEVHTVENVEFSIPDKPAECGILVTAHVEQPAMGHDLSVPDEGVQPATVEPSAEIQVEVAKVQLSVPDPSDLSATLVSVVQPAAGHQLPIGDDDVNVRPEDCGMVVNVVPPRKQLNITKELVAAMCAQFPEDVPPVPDVQLTRRSSRCRAFDAVADVEVRSVSCAKKRSESNVGVHEAAQAVIGLVDNLVSKMCEEFPQLHRSSRHHVAASVMPATAADSNGEGAKKAKCVTPSEASVPQVNRATRSAAKMVATPSVMPSVKPSVMPSVMPSVKPAMRSAAKGQVGVKGVTLSVTPSVTPAMRSVAKGQVGAKGVTPSVKPAMCSAAKVRVVTPSVMPAMRSVAKVRVVMLSVMPSVMLSVKPATRSAVKVRAATLSVSVKGVPQSVKTPSVKGAKKSQRPATRSAVKGQVGAKGVTPVYKPACFV